jgi:hypothetical protein
MALAKLPVRGPRFVTDDSGNPRPARVCECTGGSPALYGVGRYFLAMRDHAVRKTLGTALAMGPQLEEVSVGRSSENTVWATTDQGGLHHDET